MFDKKGRGSFPELRNTTISWCLFFEIIYSNYGSLKRYNMKATANKFFSLILTWILFYNFIYVSFSVPGSGYRHERIYQEITEVSFYISSNISEHLQKKENNNRLNHSFNFLSSFSETDCFAASGFTSFVKNHTVNHIHFYTFLSSHFSTGT